MADLHNMLPNHVIKLIGDATPPEFRQHIPGYQAQNPGSSQKPKGANTGNDTPPSNAGSNAWTGSFLPDPLIPGSSNSLGTLPLAELTNQWLGPSGLQSTNNAGHVAEPYSNIFASITDRFTKDLLSQIQI